MHKFTLALIGTFSEVCYWSQSLWTDGSYSWAIFNSLGITGTRRSRV